MFKLSFKIIQRNFVFDGGRIINYANCKLFLQNCTTQDLYV